MDKKKKTINDYMNVSWSNSKYEKRMASTMGYPSEGLKGNFQSQFQSTMTSRKDDSVNTYAQSKRIA